MEGKKGLLFVVSGPSGVGKSTVIRELLRSNPNLHFSVSCTTRSPRPGEEDGSHYYFLSREAFEDMIDRNEFLEYTEYVGHYYGTPLPCIRTCLDEGMDVLLDIEIEGAANVLKRLPEAVLIFLAPPSFAELERRLRNRNTDLEEKILKRLETARAEYKEAPRYHYIVINHTVEKAAQEMEAIVTAEHCKTVNRLHLLKEDIECSTQR